MLISLLVVLDTTKVQIFKQITTPTNCVLLTYQLFQIPQRYRFSSKSQRVNTQKIKGFRCFRYHKGTDFQANHNGGAFYVWQKRVVLDTTKVQIFKQITTLSKGKTQREQLFQIPQRYRFSSKSQHSFPTRKRHASCFRYHKGTDFQANHNIRLTFV